MIERGGEFSTISGFVFQMQLAFYLLDDDMVN